MNPAEKKFLLLQTAYLGDVILTLPAAQALKKKFPGCSVTYMVIPRIAEILENHPDIDKIITYDKRGTESGLRALLRKAGEIRDEHFDAAIVPHRSLRSAALCRIAAIPMTVGFDNSAGRIFFTHCIPYHAHLHEVLRNMALLEPLGIKEEPDPPELPQFKTRQAANGGQKKKLVGVHPGSAWKTKRWPADRYASLMARFRRDGFDVMLLGGIGDSEVTREIAARTNGQLTDLSGSTDLRELARSIARCDLFICNDSGPMHVAAALGVPVAALFGPTTQDMGFFPWSSNSCVVERDLPCRPCSAHGGNACPEGHFRCMREIEVEEVFEAGRRLLYAGR